MGIREERLENPSIRCETEKNLLDKRWIGEDHAAHFDIGD